MADLEGETTELLSQLIRNACINDGTPDSGHESVSADLLASYLDVPGLELQRFEPHPGRVSLLARLEGADEHAPTLMLMGHTDVVPANPHGWVRDPFGGEVVDGEVWGRGAVDMLSLTASMAVATRHLATGATGARVATRPRGTVLYLAVADEEAGGRLGAEWLAQHHPDAIRCDYVVTEPGLFRMPLPAATPGGPLRLPVTVAEKGAYWCTINVEGSPGHGARPLRTDNAVVKAAEIVSRLAAFRPEAHIPAVWRRFVEGMDLSAEDTAALVDARRIGDIAERHPLAPWAGMAHACTHTSIAPTVLRGGVKRNVIPDAAEIQLDIRTLPAHGGDEVQAMLRDALGDLWDSVRLTVDFDAPPTESTTDSPLWEALSRATSALLPTAQGSVLVPFLAAGQSDARFFRMMGATAYGFGLYSDRLSFADFATMAHGDNERIDAESLRRCAELWPLLVWELLK
ncbi:MAG TPA: M20/M25/M40 family metallo-hydrolase [Actinomycetota bacterium]|nr:M20/M25/M40 family metallo-hydrolase [Actinomycetota bacterium]